MENKPDVLVIGAGVIGCAIAYRLAREGLRVSVLDRGEIGREASWAAAGILSPIHPWDYPEALTKLCIASERLYPKFVEEIEADSGLSVEYRKTGLLMLIADDEDAAAAEKQISWRQDHGMGFERWTAVEVVEREPLVSGDLRGALFLPDVCQVRNNRLVQALAKAAASRRACFSSGAEVTGVLTENRTILGVASGNDRTYASQVIVAAGAWSSVLLKELALDFEVHPVKGQMLLLEGSVVPLSRMVLWKGAYLVPRQDEQILVGSTLEPAGFSKEVTPSAVRKLLDQALRMAPGLSHGSFKTAWAGLRPGTPNRVPYIGRPQGWHGLVIASGHYRNGILLAPITACLVEAIVRGKPPSMPLFPYRVGRVPET